MNEKEKYGSRNSSGRIGLVGLPLDIHSSYAFGPAKAPAIIRKALNCSSTNTWCESNVDSADILEDRGDLHLEAEDPLEAIRLAIDKMIRAGFRPLSLGGDHSVTLPILRALQTRWTRPAILHLDAHSDLYDTLNGNRYSHACPFARIMEEKLASRLVQAGIRTLNRHQREQALRFEAEIHEMKDWNGVPALRFDGPLYISLDMDVLDPAFAPGVSHPEPGGLSTREVIRIIQSVEAPVIVGADLVEYNPEFDFQEITARAAAKLVKELAARMAARY
ncbi:MAG TPA: agmatinase [bacterium]|nr:agmatinase [bacterium]